MAAPTAKGRHGGEAQTWTFSYGLPPHTVYARELSVGGAIQVRFTDASMPGRDKRSRKHLALRVRKAPNEDVDPKLENTVRKAIIAANARLVAGLPPFGSLMSKAPSDRANIPATPESLTLTEGFDLALDKETGKYAATDSRRYGDMLTLRDILFSPGMLDPNLTWSDLRFNHIVPLWRRMASIHQTAPERFGPRRAEVVVDALYAVASWLRKREHIASNAAVPVDGWRKELREEWVDITKRPVKVKRPRHSVDEAHAILVSLWHPERLRYREVLRVTDGGGQESLLTATRKNIVRDHLGRPIALRLRVTRKGRNGTTKTVSVRVHLDDRAGAAVAAVDSPGAALHAPLFDAPPHALIVDPRAELAVELGAELRLGQVAESRRSQLDLTRLPMAPYGTLTVHGKKNKKGETLALTEAQRVAVDRALDTLLAKAEAAYDPADPRTDYHLLPGGKLVQGAADVERARRTHITRDALRHAFHALEVAAGISPVLGRGWYGLRRISSDTAPQYTSDSRVLDKLGGWTLGSKTRPGTYQNPEDERLITKTAAVRQEVRAGTKTRLDGLPPLTETLIALLPEALRAAVLAHFGGGSLGAAVGTSVGTNDSAAGIDDSGGAVSR